MWILTIVSLNFPCGLSRLPRSVPNVLFSHVLQNKHNLAAEHSVTIQLIDVNDNYPKFSEEVTSGSVLENEPPGTPVMQVNARDIDITPIFRKVSEVNDTKRQ